MARKSIAALVVMATIVATMLVATSAHAASTLERIRERQAIVLAYRDGAAPFSFRGRDGRVQGYSAELCAQVAMHIQRQLALRELAVEWLPVDAATRIQAVASGRADAECGTTTITLSRMETVDFSLPIFVDGGAIAVRNGSAIRRVRDLQGRRVAVIFGTTTERALRAALELADVRASLVAVSRPEEGAEALRAGRVDAHAGDRIVLTRLAEGADDGSIAVLPDDFSFEPYGIVLPRGDADFRLAVNRALAAVYRQGGIDAIFQKWLAPLGKPSALLNAMFYLNAYPE